MAMNDGPDKRPASPRPAAGRDERLASQLRANLRRRKAQARGRAAGEGSDSSESAPRNRADRPDEEPA